MGALDMTKKTGDLFFAENGHGLWSFLGPDMGNFPIQVLIKHLPVKEDDGIQGLALRGRRYLPFYRQVGKKAFHIPDAKVPGMGLAAKEIDKTPYPLVVGLLSAVGIVMIAQHLTYLVHQFEFRIRMKLRFIFHVVRLNIAIDGKIKLKRYRQKAFSASDILI